MRTPEQPICVCLCDSFSLESHRAVMLAGCLEVEKCFQPCTATQRRGSCVECTCSPITAVISLAELACSQTWVDQDTE